ncbi:MAG: DUF1707 and DUF4870 domain-containing protein [Brooklawnia sp.]
MSYGQAPDAPVSEPDRDRAERLLHQAHREGRITTTDFEERFTRAMNATRAGQLYSAIQNIPAPVSQAMVRVGEQYQRARSGQPQQGWTPAIRQADTERNAALTHLSGMFTWIFGPLVIHSVSRPGSVLRREAAKAFNYQLAAGGIFLAASMVFGILGLGSLTGLVWLSWLGLTIMSAVKAGNGHDWTNPLTRVTKVNLLDPTGR